MYKIIIHPAKTWEYISFSEDENLQIVKKQFEQVCYYAKLVKIIGDSEYFIGETLPSEKNKESFWNMVERKIGMLNEAK
jgi:hypothetical protein